MVAVIPLLLMPDSPRYFLVNKRKWIKLLLFQVIDGDLYNMSFISFKF